MTLTVKTYDGKALGTIALQGDTLAGSTPAVQEIADARVRREGSAAAAYRSLNGWQNGYLYAAPSSEDAGTGKIALTARELAEVAKCRSDKLSPFTIHEMICCAKVS